VGVRAHGHSIIRRTCAAARAMADWSARSENTIVFSASSFARLPCSFVAFASAARFAAS
jgi:hypothetical protein